jgi:hypothetical protein
MYVLRCCFIGRIGNDGPQQVFFVTALITREQLANTMNETAVPPRKSDSG